MKIVRSRVEPLLDYCRGKTVLDIGCVGMGRNDTIEGHNFLHGKLKPVVRKLVGVDIQAEAVERLNGMGYDIRLQSADEPFDLNERFEVVIAEELIEHLQNLKTFYQNVRCHLESGGQLILTSPNPQAFEFFIQQLLFHQPLVNPYHTHWHTPQTIEYLSRVNGFSLEESFYIEEWPDQLRGRIYQALFCWLPARFSRNVAYRFTRDGGGD